MQIVCQNKEEDLELAVLEQRRWERRRLVQLTKCLYSWSVGAAVGMWLLSWCGTVKGTVSWGQEWSSDRGCVWSCRAQSSGSHRHKSCSHLIRRTAKSHLQHRCQWVLVRPNRAHSSPFCCAWRQWIVEAWRFVGGREKECLVKVICC